MKIPMVVNKFSSSLDGCVVLLETKSVIVSDDLRLSGTLLMEFHGTIASDMYPGMKFDIEIKSHKEVE